MSLHLITGYAGQEHITAADHASFNVSVFGKDNFVFERGNRFKAETISNNLIRILDGDLMIQGRHVRLAENTYEELQIENGTQGMKRYDCIVARYTKDAATGIEKCEFVVVKGEENATAGKEPELTKGDITEQGNDLVTDYLLYRVELEGINIVTVRKMFKTKNLLQNAIVPTYRKITLNTQGWHRIAQIKTDSLNKASGSLGNCCDIEINRPYMNGRNEFHKIQLVSMYTKSVFQDESSNGIDAFYITKIRHVVDTNTNTTYLEIYYNASSENQPIVTLSNHMNFDNMFWEIIEPELTAETVDGVTVLGSYEFSLNMPSGIRKWTPNATSFNSDRCIYRKTQDMLTVWFSLNLATEVNITTKTAVICNDLKSTFGLSNFEKGISNSNFYALNIVNAGASYSPPTLLCIAQNNRLLIQYMGANNIPTAATIYGQINIPIY